jgi:hypothetical protein
MKKIFIIFFVFCALNGCANSVALLGPASTSVTGGNIAQSALTSSLSYGIKKQTGQSPSEHIITYVKKHNPENKKEKCIKFVKATNSTACAAVKENISETKKKFVKIKKSIFNKYKIENLAKESDLFKR